MKYTLITARGKIYTFFIRELAYQYQAAYGGTLVTNQVFDDITIPVAI
jgi:hypothetical protein